jgi:hypothetical protein
VDRQPVTSRALRSVGYNEQSSVLEIEFQNGTVYEFFDVPKVVHESLLAAPSIGRFFDAWIKPRFEFREIL